MKAPSVDIKDILIADTTLVFGTDLFIAVEPDSPDNIVTIYDSGGSPPDFIRYRRPTVQIRCRNTDYSSGWNQINNVVNTLEAVASRTVGADSTYHTTWWLESDIIFLEQDDQDRYLFSANLQGHRSD